MGIIKKNTLFSMRFKFFFSVIFIGISFLVFNVGGYNNFITTGSKPIIRIIVLAILAISTYIAWKIKKFHSFWQILFSFTISSLGLTAAWYLGQWYKIIPGLSTATIVGAAIAKLAEVLPIVIAILVGIWILNKDFSKVFIKGGNLKESFKLAFIFSPLGLIPFLALGGLNLSVESNLFLNWIPWILVFSFSNSFMEELMIRGLFLRKYSVFIGQKGSLLLTSIIFALFHFGLLENTDFVTAITFYIITFILGFSWGYIIQKSENIWGSVLAHMIADALGLIAVFGTI